MTDDQMSDIKDFISSTANQTEIRLQYDLKDFVSGKVDGLEAKLTQRIDGLEQKMDNGFVRLEKKLDDGFSGVADSFEQISELIDQDHKSTDKRLTALEQKLA